MLAGILGNFIGKRILVLGDVILDQYIWGNVDRISPEAPVPIVAVTDETFRLGGAANAAANICSLGGKVSIASVVGDDENGHKLSRMLSDIGADVSGMIFHKGRPTILKTRIIAHHQHVVRIDREVKDEIQDHVREEIVAQVKTSIPNVDAILVSDYDKGVLSKSVLGEVISLGKKCDKPIVIDPKRRNFWNYVGATVVTPNIKEASEAVNHALSSEEDLLCAGKTILERLGLEALLITRGEDGMTLLSFAEIEEDGKPVNQVNVTHVPAVAREVFDVTGAGDTTVAVFTLSLASGADFISAAKISNYAAGIVVGKVGTACVTQEELSQVIRQYQV